MGTELVFSIARTPGTAELTLTQFRAVTHPDTSNPDDPLILVNNAVSLYRGVRVTDGDGDAVDSGSITNPRSNRVNIGEQFVFRDDGPSADNDSVTTPEDTAVTVNVLSNDSAGADGGKTLVSAVLVNPLHGSVVVNTVTGQITFTPAPGFAGVASIDYVMQDGDGDTDTAQLAVTVAPDSTPTVGWVLTGPGAVDEGALPNGILGGSTTTSGSLNIATGGDAVNAVGGVTINGADVTAGGTVAGTYGELVVTVLGGVYSWTYTLYDNATHTDAGAVGAADQWPEEAFEVVVTDSDGDATPPAPLVILINDDGPVDVTPVGAVLSNAAGSVSGPLALDADGDVSNNYGADGAGTVVFASHLDGAAALSAATGLPLTAAGLPITYSLSPDGLVLTASTVIGTVYTVTLDPTNSTYQIEMFASVDGGTPVIDFNSAGGYNFVGGNASWAGFNTTPNDNSRDLLLTPMVGGVSGGTLNSTASTGGVSGGASVGVGEAMRVDYVIDLSGSPVSGGSFGVLANQTQLFDGHYTTNGSTALIGVGGSATNTTDITITAFDDDDSGVVKNVGDGTPDDIVAVSIAYGGSTQLVLASGGGVQAVVVGGVSYTVTFDASGTVTVAGIRNGSAIGAFTTDGYNSLEYAHAGGSTFQIGDFGAAGLTPGDPVELALPVTVYDGDGDPADGQIEAVLSPLGLGGRSLLAADTIALDTEGSDAMAEVVPAVLYTVGGNGALDAADVLDDGANGLLLPQADGFHAPLGNTRSWDDASLWPTPAEWRPQPGRDDRDFA